MKRGTGISTQRLNTLSTGSIYSDDKAPEWNLKRIYGREKESKIIQNCVDKGSNGVIILKGCSGSGKSFFVDGQHFEEDGWIYATGKHDMRRKQEPYSALIDALDGLVAKWMANNSAAQLCRMNSFNNLLVDDMEFLETIVPKMFREVKAECYKSRPKGLQTTSSQFGTEATVDSKTINAAFWRIMSFLSESKPIIFFLDDLQWADQASLDAIQALSTTGNIEGFWLILSYRDEEVSEGDPVSTCLDFIKEENECVETIHITNLDEENVNNIVCSLLEQDPEQTSELSKVIHNKTAGNPFFVIQFMKMLRHESFLNYNAMILQWEWGDVGKMEQIVHVSDNVADIIAASMSKLTESSLFALQMASCLGKVVPMQVLIEFIGTCVVEEASNDEELAICGALVGIQLQGLKDVFDEAVKFGILVRLEDDETYVWAHDKLQFVAYSMIRRKNLNKVHKSLGMILRNMYESNPENCWALYMAADQLNRLTNVCDDNLNADIALSSLQASKISISKSAFFPALDMLRSAAEHLTAIADPWKTNYQLSLEVLSSLAEMAMRFGSHKEAINAAIQVDRNAKILEDRSRAQFIFILHKLEGGNRDYKGAVESIKSILLDYGVKFPTKIMPGQLILEYRKLRTRLGGAGEAFLNLRHLNDAHPKDRRTKIIIILLARLIEYLDHGEKTTDLQSYAAMRILNISSKEGTCAATALGVACFGSNMIQDGREYDAREFGELAIKLVDSFPSKVGSCHALVHSWVAYGVLSQAVPFHDLLDPLLDLNRISLRGGGISEGAMAWIGYAYTYMCVGLPLHPLDLDLLSFSKNARQFRLPATFKVLFPIIRQAIQNLQELKSNPTLLKGDAFDQEKELKNFKDLGHKMTLRDINSFRLMLACIYQDWKIAEELVVALEPYLHGDKLFIRGHILLVYMGYACIVLSRRANMITRLHHRQLGRKIIKTFKDQLKNGSPNALPVVMMLEAIESPSKERFDEAIRVTARLGMVQHAAVVYENAGLFFTEQGNEGLAEYYFSEASKLYTDWGATGKTKDMIEKHNFLGSSSLNRNQSNGFIKGRTRFSPETMLSMQEIKIGPGSSERISDITGGISKGSNLSSSVASTLFSTSK
ncbi:unnamed protein product [Pseudo-nitzschia multistriata]|uniref:Orc1-like AAA ATPase domain-containing protein n=1 Tax=Pseudo-nitzschia multistriata TaxID=183589 RepID=A0A448Z8W0_9STRA|nr:unnamed protein product [Pseudo-nitzschia multistriata]